MKVHLLVIGVIFSILVATGCNSPDSSAEDTNPCSIDTGKGISLKTLAADKSISIGTLYNYAYSQSSYDDSDCYNTTIVSDFDTISLEWEFAMDEIWQGEYSYDYTYLDKALEFARDNGLKVRGTHLLWYSTIPEWLEEGSYTGTQVAAFLQSYIDALFGHIESNYPGIVVEINVVNEVIRDDNDSDATYGDLRNTFWAQKLGSSYVEDVFNWADSARIAASSNAKFYINDYDIELESGKQDRFITLLDNLIAASVPVDGVGLQAHFSIHDNIDDAFDKTEFTNVLNEYAGKGMEISLTELDVRINDDETRKTSTKLDEQKALYKQVVEICLTVSAVKGIHLWGFNDDLSYLNGSADWLPQNRDWGLIFDGAYQAKPAYYGIAEALQEP